MDYYDSFSLIVKVVTVRIFFVIAASNNWLIEHMNINNAFLYGRLKEEIYMRALEGYSIPHSQVCKLNISLYGLKQANREYNCELTYHLVACRFTQYAQDHFLLTMTTSTSFLALLAYVDDLLLMESFIWMRFQLLKIHYIELFINDLGSVKYFWFRSYTIRFGYVY